MVWAFLTFSLHSVRRLNSRGCLSLAKKKRRNHGKMPIDKFWMQSGRSSEDYFNGVETFLDYAYNHLQPDDAKILCPCVEVQQHLLYNGIIKNYTRWHLHGEDENDETDESNSDSDSDGSENDVINMEQDDDMHGLVEEGCPQDPNRDAEKFYKWLLHYTEGIRVVLFNCEWYDIVRKGTGYKIDSYGIITNQATQAFYVREIKNKAWSYVVETKPRNVYEMPNVDDDDDPYQEEEVHGGIQANQNDDEDDEIVG
ncbi:unnamed protein product [Malus baccata var. baccata]